MNRFPKLLALVVGLLTSFLTFCAGVAVTIVVGQATDSGMFGICGPYGEYAGLLFLIFLGTLPASVASGIFVGFCVCRCLTRSQDEEN